MGFMGWRRRLEGQAFTLESFASTMISQLGRNLGLGTFRTEAGRVCTFADRTRRAKR